MHETRVPVRELVAQVAAIFEATHVAREDARVAAAHLVQADCRGIATHGVARVASYASMLRAGSVNPSPSLQWDPVFPCVMRVDGDNGLGQVVGTRVMQRLIQHARDHGIALATIEDCGHLGAIGLYALEAADANMMAVVMQATHPVMVPPGGTIPAIGNNPIAFAAPIPDSPPLVFDMSCSVAARGNILLAARSGERIPDGWAVDKYGVPTTDPIAAMDGGMLPVGGYKGLGIALMVQFLAGILPGVDTYLLQDSAGPSVTSAFPHGGAFMLVLNAASIASDEQTLQKRVTRWIEAYRQSAGAASRLPGQEAARLERDAAEHGVPLRDEILEELREISRVAGVPYFPGVSDTDEADA